MRVVHLTTVHPVQDPRILYKECVSLARGGHEVHLVARAANAGAERLPSVRGLTVHLVGAATPVTRLRRATLEARVAVRFARSLQADLYHLHDPELLLWAWMLRQDGRAVVFDMHENLPLAILDKGWIPRPIRGGVSQAVAAAERRLLQGWPVVFAEVSYKDYYPHVGRAVDVLNYPIEASLTPAPAPPGRPFTLDNPFTLGYVGGVSEARGLFTTLEAMRRLKARGLPMAFECVGPISAPDRRQAEEYCVTHGLAAVRFHGRRPPPEAWALMARAHVGLAVLRQSGNYERSLPTKLLEYMGLGLPVIASDFPLYRNVVHGAGCGLTVPPDRPEQLAEAILALARDRRAAEKMGRRGRRAVLERYTWSSQAQRLLAFYAQLIPRQRRGAA